MDFGRKLWIRATIFVGVVYFIVGYGSAVLDPFVPDRARFIWRLAAWVVTALVYTAHLGYEHFRVQDSPLATAMHVALAVALGAFLIVVAATARATTMASHAPFKRYFVALVLWPVLTGLPAFLVALVVSAMSRRFLTRAVHTSEQ